MDDDFWAIVDSPTKFKAVFQEKPQAFVKASFTKGEAVKMSGRIHIICSSANRAARRRNDHDR